MTAAFEQSLSFIVCIVILLNSYMEKVGTILKIFTSPVLTHLKHRI